MPTVKVEFRVSARGRSSQKSQLGVLELEPLDRADIEVECRTIRSLRAPIGSTAITEKVQIFPGRYLARLRLPSGEQFNEVVEIGEGPAQQKILLGVSKPTAGVKVFHGPSLPVPTVRESLAKYGQLATYAPDVFLELPKLASPTTLGFQIPPSGLPFVQWGVKEAVEQRWLAQVNRNQSISLSDYLRTMSEGQSDWWQILKEHAEVKVAACVGNSRQLLSGLAASQSAISANLRGEELFDALGVRFSDHTFRLEKYTRSRSRVIVDQLGHEPLWPVANYAVVSSTLHGSISAGNTDSQVKLVRLPGEWRGVHDGHPREVFMDIRRHSNVQPFGISVNVADPKIQTVLDFSQQKDLNGALVVLEQSLDMLFRKVVNPYAAAAAAYVMLLAPPQLMPPKCHEWVANLGRWFQDLPDGPIQHATLLLQRPLQTDAVPNLERDFFPENDVERSRLAAELILESLGRGLPLYQSGFMFLASNLSILSDDSDLPRDLREPIRLAQKVVNTLRLRLDTTQPFTVLDISDLI